MGELKDFMEIIVGEFSNERQWQALKEADFPLAEHTNTEVTDKIHHLPADFKGAFLLEENRYTLRGNERKSAHLFSFTWTGKDILMLSYVLPKTADHRVVKTYRDLPDMDFRDLELSPHFTEAHFIPDEQGVWKTHSVTEDNGTEFVLDEVFNYKQLIVDEKKIKNGRMIFGFNEPIVYDRIG